MVLIGRRLSTDELRAVLDDPETVGTLLYGDLDDEDAEMPGPELDLDKSWHGLHYLLTGTGWDLGDGAAGAAVLGGDEIGEDGGYGPARLVRPEAVQAVADALDAVDVERLRARFDPDAMAAAEIYPHGWEAGGDSYLVSYFAQLRGFYRNAAAGGQAILLAIT
jgi:hypothetical protein